MAVSQRKSACAVLFTVEVGTTPAGGAKFATRSFSRVNPNITDEDAYDVASGLAALQSYPVGDIARRNTVILVNA